MERIMFLYILIYIICYVISFYMFKKLIELYSHKTTDISEYGILRIILTMIPLNIVPFLLPILLGYFYISELYKVIKYYKYVFEHNMKKINEFNK